MAFRDQSESTGHRPAPKPKKPKPYTPPPYKVGMGDVKTNADRKRAEDYKSGKTAPSKGNPTYAQSFRAGYNAASPEARRASTDKAESRSKLKGPKTFNGMDLSMSREDKIVLQEHRRRIRALEMARDFVNPNNDVSADMSVAKTYKKDNPYFDESGRLQTGQTAYGERPKSDADTRMAANHPGIETAPDRLVADFANQVNDSLPLWYRRGDIQRAPGDYSKSSGYHDPMKDIVPVDSDAVVKKGGKAGQILAAVDFATNANNIASQAGHLGGNLINAGLGEVDKLPLAFNLLPQVGALKALSQAGDVPGNAFKDVVDVYAQAAPSAYQLGAAAADASHGDTAKAKEQWEGLKQIAEHPGKSLHDHPLLVGMLAKGGLSVVGRAGGAAARDVGRLAADTNLPQGVRSAAGKVGAAGSTLGRQPIVLPGKGTTVNRRYSHDIISKHLVQKPADRIARSDNPVGRYIHRQQSHLWEKRVGDELHGSNQSNRKLNRAAGNHFMSKVLPRHEAAKALVPFIAERVVRTPETMKADLEQRLANLKHEADKLKAEPAHEGKASKLHDNRAMQLRITELLSNDKLMAGGKHANQAFKAATDMAHRQNIADARSVSLGHINQEQVDKAKGFTYAIEHMDAVYDETARPTGRKLMKDHLTEAERKAAQAADAAKGKYDTAERAVRDEQKRHKTLESRGAVPGGRERPLVLQALDHQLHEVRKKLGRANRSTEAQAGRAGEAAGSARVRADKYDRSLLKSDGHYRKLRGEFSRTSQEKQAAQVHFRNTHERGKAMYSDAERAEALQRLDATTEAHDVSHANLHAYLDDVDAAAARGTTKLAGHSSSTTKAEVHYSSKGRGPKGALRRAEHEQGKLKLSREERARLYAHETHLERQLAKAERESSKLKSTDHERLRQLRERRDELKAEHEHAANEHQAVREGNKMFGNVNKGDAEFIPGLTHPDGRQMTAADIDTHMREVSGIEGGLNDTMWFTHRPGISAAASGNVRGAEDAPQFEKRFTRSGAAARGGFYDNSLEAVANSMTRSQGILDAISGRRRFVDTFVKPKDVDANGNVWYSNGDQAARAARDYNVEHGYLKKGDPRAMLPYQVTDSRLDAARRRAQQDHFDVDADEVLRREAELADNPSLGADTTRFSPSGDFGLVSRGAWKRMQDHENAAHAGAGGFGEFTQKWRNAVLYGTSMPKWVTGNLAELTLRLAVAGAGPRSLYLGWKIMAEVEKQADHPQEAAFIRAYLTGGGHFTGNIQREINFAKQQTDGLRGALHELGEKPGPAQLFGAWEAYKRVINFVNKEPELGGSYAGIGKLALKDREAWEHLNSGWKDAMSMSDAAIKQTARGLLDTSEHVRYARFVYNTIGRYTNLSPAMRKWVANYSPFGLWFVNALKFGLVTIPRDHPVFGALLSASYLATEKDRTEIGQTLWAGDLPDFLQGTVVHKGWGPGGNTNHNYTRFLPFGAFTDPATTASQNLLPQFSDFTLGLTGANFTGNKQELSDGSTVRLDDRLKYAVYTTLEGMVPFLSVAHQVAEKKGKPYMDDYIWSLKTKPGTQTDTHFQALKSVTLPAYGYKNSSKKTGKRKSPLTIPDVPDIKIPDINIP